MVFLKKKIKKVIVLKNNGILFKAQYYLINFFKELYIHVIVLVETHKKNFI